MLSFDGFLYIFRMHFKDIRRRGRKKPLAHYTLKKSMHGLCDAMELFQLVHVEQMIFEG